MESNQQRDLEDSLIQKNKTGNGEDDNEINTDLAEKYLLALKKGSSSGGRVKVGGQYYELVPTDPPELLADIPREKEKAVVKKEKLTAADLPNLNAKEAAFERSIEIVQRVIRNRRLIVNIPMVLTMLSIGIFMIERAIAFTSFKSTLYDDLENQLQSLFQLSEVYYKQLANNTFDEQSWQNDINTFPCLSRLYTGCAVSSVGPSPSWDCYFAAAIRYPIPHCSDHNHPGFTIILPDLCQQALQSWCDVTAQVVAMIPPLNPFSSNYTFDNFDSYAEEVFYNLTGNALLFYLFLATFGELAPLAILMCVTLRSLVDNCFQRCFDLSDDECSELSSIVQIHQFDCFYLDDLPRTLGNCQVFLKETRELKQKLLALPQPPAASILTEQSSSAVNALESIRPFKVDSTDVAQKTSGVDEHSPALEEVKLAGETKIQAVDSSGSASSSPLSRRQSNGSVVPVSIFPQPLLGVQQAPVLGPIAFRLN